MTDARAKRLEELFRLGVEVPRAERDAFLERHCADDPALARELADLLAQDDHGTKPYLASPVLSAWSREGDTGSAAESGPARDAGARARGDRIGRYRIVRQLGEGGMGVVYLAEQEEPVRREVALKIVKLGMDTRRVVARFENERQALAVMDHPGIARIFDGGTTENGRPYFVMEYVEGAPLTEFCDQHALGVAERLGLFVRVCEAVQHAHAKGVVHRDLKPSNVLVAVRDRVHVPKVIDFGIARATSEPRGEAKERPTRASEVVGTYAYMSPEQADPLGAEVDAKSDVYALGVMLYELLTGVLPHDADALAGKSPSEVSRLLADVDPPAPSTKITCLGPRSAALAERRGGLDPRSLARRTSGDLDWITLKAMERDPARRYPSAYALALDVRRHLANQTVSAGPPSHAYRLRKYVRRHRTGVSAAALFLLSVASGAAGTALGFREASAEAVEARAQLQSAERRLLNIQDMGEFMLAAFRLADPEAAWLADESSLSELRRMREHVADVFREDPLGEARVRVLFARLLRGRGELELAREDLERAVVLQRSHEASTEDRYETSDELHRLSVDTSGYASFAAGLEKAHLGVELLSATSPDAGAAAAHLLNDAETIDLARIELDLSLLEKAAAGLGARDARIAADLVGLAGAYLGLHLAFAEAEPLLERAVTLREASLGATHPEVVLALADLVEHDLRLGRLDRARAALESRLPAFEQRFPTGHWMRAEVESMLGECLSLSGDLARAEDLLASASRALVRERGPRSRAAVHAQLRLREHFARAGETLLANQLDDAADSPLARSRDRRGAWTRTAEALGAEGEVADALIALLDAAGGDARESAPSMQTVRTLERLLHDRGADDALARIVKDALVALEPRLSIDPRFTDDAPLSLALEGLFATARTLTALPETARVEPARPRESEPAYEGELDLGPKTFAVEADPAVVPATPAAEVLAAPKAATPPPVEAPPAEDAAAEEPEPKTDVSKLLTGAWYQVLASDSTPDAYYQAFVDVTHAVKYDPEVELYFEVLALSLVRLEQSDAALGLLDDVATNANLDAVGLTVKALALVELGRHAEAAKQLEQAVALGSVQWKSLPPDADVLVGEVWRRIELRR